MRLPIRRSERLKKGGNDGPIYLTKEGLEKMKQTLEKLEKVDLPQSIQDVRITGEFGDFSENAEYQEAKARMRRLHGQIFGLKEKIKHAVLIETDPNLAIVQLGSTVVLEKSGKTITFQIVGPQEVDPTRGRISHVSPLGASLLGHKVNDTVSGYLIQSIK